MSVNARINRLKELKDIAAGVVRIGTDTAERAVRAASPHVSGAAALVRARLRGPDVTPPPGADPVPVPPPAATPAATSATVRETVPTSRVPNPASVARNIAPHPPAPAPPKPRTPAPKAVPGAKLPPRRRPADEGRD